MQAVVKLIRKLLMSSSSNVNGLYSVVFFIPSRFGPEFDLNTGISVKATSPNYAPPQERPWGLFSSLPPWCCLSYQLCGGPVDPPFYVYVWKCMRWCGCKKKNLDTWFRLVRDSETVGWGHLLVGEEGEGEPRGSLEWCGRLPSLLVGFVGMWERRILAPGEPRQSAADFMPSVSASIVSLPNSSDLYFLSLFLLLIPVHKRSGHTEIC